MKIILDTNIWISFLLGKRLSELTEIFKREDIQVYVSEELINEIRAVATRSKFSKVISPHSLDELMELITIKCEYVSSITPDIPDIRDKKDIFILGMAENIPADFIVTGDNDLLVLKSFQGIPILKFNEFKSELK